MQGNKDAVAAAGKIASATRLDGEPLYRLEDALGATLGRRTD
jgi:hypothetical protein